MNTPDSSDVFRFISFLVALDTWKLGIVSILCDGVFMFTLEIYISVYMLESQWTQAPEKGRSVL